MRAKLPRKWVKCFTWWPMYITNGYRDSGSVVWLEFVYRRWNVDHVEIITMFDYDYIHDMQEKMLSDPERFGSEVWRELP